MKSHLWLLHGALGAADDWQALSRDFHAAGIETHPVNLWQLPHRGGASWCDAAAAVNRRVARVPGRHVLAGYSLGGRLALHILRQQPSFWHAAALISTHPGLLSLRERRRRRAGDRRWFELSQHDPAQFWQQWLAQSVFASTALPATWQHRAAQPAPRQHAHASFVTWSLGRQQPLHAWLRRAPLPLLWLSGENDEKFTRSATQLQQQCCNGNLQHYLIAQAGHRIPWEQPARCVELIRTLFTATPHNHSNAATPPTAR